MRATLLAAAAAILVSACGSTPKDRRLDFATVQTLNPGVDGKWVLEEFPQASNVDRDANGKIRRIDYGVTDPQGRPQTLNLMFDEQEVLVRKQYSGPLLRPELGGVSAPHDVQTQPGRGAPTR
jgi:hypothetical protein